MKKTKIVCTIGPRTESEEMLTRLLDAGMNVMRLNFSHGNYQEHGERIKRLRAVMEKTGYQAAILLDTKGPEIRTMRLQAGKDVSLIAGQTFTFTTDQQVIGNEQQVAVTYPGFADDLSVGDRILVDDGLIAMDVSEIKNNLVICTVLNGGDLGENKGINLPALAEKDRSDLIFGCQQGVDFIAASFN